jgi:hypothetical protein
LSNCFITSNKTSRFFKKETRFCLLFIVIHFFLRDLLFVHGLIFLGIVAITTSVMMLSWGSVVESVMRKLNLIY